MALFSAAFRGTQGAKLETRRTQAVDRLLSRRPWRGAAAPSTYFFSVSVRTNGRRKSTAHRGTRLAARSLFFGVVPPQMPNSITASVYNGYNFQNLLDFFASRHSNKHVACYKSFLKLEYLILNHLRRP